MALQAVRFDSPAALRDAAGPFLMRDEAQHNIVLGLLGTLEAAPEYSAEQPYFGAVVSGDDVVLVGVMTPPLQPVLSLCEDDGAIGLLAADLASYRRDLPSVLAPVPVGERFSVAWRSLTGDRYRPGLAERSYRLDKLVEPPPPPGFARRMTEADLELLSQWTVEFQREAVPHEEPDLEGARRSLEMRLKMAPENRGMFVWDDDGLVCLVGYGNPTPNSLRIAPVYTPPEKRGRGYATACTAAACRYILGAGYSFVTLETDVTNPVSNHVYPKLGFYPVGESCLYLFER